MLDHFSIFNRNGIVLWSECLSKDVSAGESVHDLVRYVLLEERAVSTYDSGKYQLKWTLANDLDLVFVAVFNKMFSKTLNYIDELLASVKQVSFHGTWQPAGKHRTFVAGLPTLTRR
jgi:signal recognition particle receptor subunit alpha